MNLDCCPQIPDRRSAVPSAQPMLGLWPHLAYAEPNEKAPHTEGLGEEEVARGRLELPTS